MYLLIAALFIIGIFVYCCWHAVKCESVTMMLSCYFLIDIRVLKKKFEKKRKPKAQPAQTQDTKIANRLKIKLNLNQLISNYFGQFGWEFHKLKSSVSIGQH